jgi:hypothetical protein
MEKVHRLYDGDVSRVLDICRQRIIFDTVASMLACLKAVLTDNQVVVERIINCFSTKYDERAYGTYRYVCPVVSLWRMSIPLVSHTCMYGMHICALRRLCSNQVSASFAAGLIFWIMARTRVVCLTSKEVKVFSQQPPWLTYLHCTEYPSALCRAPTCTV